MNFTAFCPSVGKTSTASKSPSHYGFFLFSALPPLF